MREEAEDFRQSLLEKYGTAIDYGFIDVDAEEMQKYPEAQAFQDTSPLYLNQWSAQFSRWLFD